MRSLCLRLPILLWVCSLCPFRVHAVVQAPLQVAVLPQLPFVQCDGVIRGAACSGKWFGFVVDLLQAALDAANKKNTSTVFSAQYYAVIDGSFGTKQPSGAWSGLIGEVTGGKADIGAAATLLSTSRLGAMQFSVPWFTAPFALMIRTPVPEPNPWSFVKPFSGGLWGAILCTTILFAAALVTAERLSPFGMRYDPLLSPNEKRSWSSSEAIATAFGALFGAGGGKSVAWSTRLIMFGMYFASLITLANYTANLTAFAAVKQYREPIATLADVVRERVPIAIVTNGTVGTWILNHQDPQIRSIATFWTPVASYADAAALLQSGSVDAAFGTKPSLEIYAISPPCGFSIVSELSFGYYAFAFPKTSSWFTGINTALQGVIESGYVPTLNDQYFLDRCASITTIDANMLSVPDFMGVFYSILAFMGIALISLLVEQQAFRNRHKAAPCKFWRRLNICCGYHYNPDKANAPPSLDTEKLAGGIRAVRRFSQSQIRRMSTSLRRPSLGSRKSLNPFSPSTPGRYSDSKAVEWLMPGQLVASPMQATKGPPIIAMES